MTPFDDAWMANRAALTHMAYTALGEWGTAEDVVSAAWERGHQYLRSGGTIEHPAAWLRVTAARLSIDEARSARHRRESYVGTWLPEPVPTALLVEDAVVERSMLSLGFLRLIQSLGPLERVVFVLREGFSLPYAEISAVVERSPEHCRQIITRAKRTLRENPIPSSSTAEADGEILTRLVTAVVDGDLEGVVHLMSQQCVLVSDSGGTLRVAPNPICGSARIARFFRGVQNKNPVQTMRLVALNGGAGLLVSAADGDRVVTIEREEAGNVSTIYLHANPAKIARVISSEAGLGH